MYSTCTGMKKVNCLMTYQAVKGTKVAIHLREFA